MGATWEIRLSGPCSSALLPLTTLLLVKFCYVLQWLYCFHALVIKLLTDHKIYRNFADRIGDILRPT